MTAHQRKNFWRIGEPGVWLAAAALGLTVAMILLFAGIISVNAMRHLLAPKLALITVRDGGTFLGVAQKNELAPEGGRRTQYKVANRELNNRADFRWLDDAAVAAITYPLAAALVERDGGGDFYGFLTGAEIAGETRNFAADFAGAVELWQTTLARVNPPIDRAQQKLAYLSETLRAGQLRQLRLQYAAHNARGRETAQKELDLLDAENAAIKQASVAELARLQALQAAADREIFIFQTAERQTVRLPIRAIARLTFPNALSFAGRQKYMAARAWTILSAMPREANTEGGVLPNILGTVILIFLMAISAFPFGVIAGIYLREYARDGALTRLIRIAVNNLAGIPSIVYGIFGLSFFIYGIGGTLDQILYPERVAAGITTFGTGGILWASLTLGLLTLPVVIVATEEALGAVPAEIRQGSLALGATRWQTLWRATLPMASPGILTGFILAIARAAGEVAPLMLTGVVKSAPAMPLDSIFPFAHLERKFMHLGFHIYDVGFQSPNVEAAKPLVYVTALLLLLLVFTLNVVAIKLRNYMRKKYAAHAL
ncbi:phosphate transport system permease protein PstA [Planctomycetales bacterium]|nr:phosphate transport system permease protein PstA [Planctomycetales bacterium]GHT06415.1 phosphate transport system permease protein PstA [Planctomycetales bacterium]GHV19233.1 phosphate transport system permease protein PstA [Planctomycetales bacterium]